MSTQTEPSDHLRRTLETSADATERRPAGRTIVLSLIAGAVAALVLVLGVFAGGTEATITGALLLGFGFGWALIATLTLRRTRQPQRWAVVPAVMMGATGAVLVALSPGSETMTALNWVWPPLMLALTTWMFLQVRRSLTGKARWVITPVIAVLALASIGATYENIALAGDTTYAAPGKLYDVGGHQVHLNCQGEGSPTVVLSNSLGGVSAGWARITGPVADNTRVCAYDRAGQGWSDEAASPRDGVQSAEELHTLLTAAGEEGPYVLVGHSTGGTYAMTYAARYPGQVAGLVLLDSSSPQQFTAMPAFEGQYAVMRRAYALLPTLSRLGLGRLVPATAHLPAADAVEVEAITSTSQGYRNQRDEVSVLPDLFTQAQTVTALGDRPLAVLTASENSNGIEGWADAQDHLAGLSTNRIHRTVESTHTGLLEDARPAAESVRAITQVISSVRSGRPLPAS